MKYQAGDKVIINGEEKVIDGIYCDNYVMVGKTLVKESEIVDTEMYNMIKSALKTMISNGDLKIDIERTEERGKTWWEDGIGTTPVYDYLYLNIKMDDEIIFKRRVRF